jgi:exoribonuclease-2
VPGTESLPRGSRVRARVTGIDLLTLDLHAALAARIEAEPATAEDESEEEIESSGPLTLAIDVEEAATAAAPGDAVA